VNGFWLRAADAEEIVRPRRLIGRFWAALNFTVRCHGNVPISGSFADRTLVVTSPNRCRSALR